MLTALTTAPVPSVITSEDTFHLDVQVTTDAGNGYATRGCDTSDTCGTTCASACVSN
jgi:FxLD family lantipeptide